MSATVFSKVRAALYAGSTTAIRLPDNINHSPLLSQNKRTIVLYSFDFHAQVIRIAFGTISSGTPDHVFPASNSGS
jgi:hypothetical protein